ncbi:aspartate racemase [Virgibacillus phasianinus]|uniref:Aspartate racemase n=1 Tax=Virgibacillus phasianinus TaxID=2017483 RepID=A0A220U3F8_9BACI|nr:aspartate/glutamate racemase family protein [Virgibacillus phasianinus]ASK62679.1 aspartate racemase [Virgibacillus phasianinus]
MKTIGLVGGMSWGSSVEYYRQINQKVGNLVGGLVSAECILYSVNFDEVEKLQRNGQWEKASDMLCNIAKKLEFAGADCIVICTNTMHKVADKVKEVLNVPLIHIGDATAEAILKDKISKIGLLGTRYTMEGDFYYDKLVIRGIQVVTPEEMARKELNRIIFEELCQGSFQQNSKETIQAMIEELRLAGAKAIVLGCTEIPLIIKQADSSLPIYNTLDIHVSKAVEFALK